MEVKILEKSERQVQFLVSDIDNTLANAIRRAAMSEVPVMAIEVVDITDNNSGLADEVLAHRLGLIPLKFPLETFNVKKECTCKGRGCSNCQVELALNKQGPGVAKAGEFVSENKDVAPLYPDMPIVELLEGQAVNITALAELGYGKDHAKWQAAIAGYRNAPKVKLNPEKGDTLPAFKVCPKKVFDKEGNKAVVARAQNCDLNMRCVEVTSPGVVEIGTKENDFIFTVESASGLTAQQVVERALEVLSERAEEFKKELKKSL